MFEAHRGSILISDLGVFELVPSYFLLLGLTLPLMVLCLELIDLRFSDLWQQLVEDIVDHAE